MDSKIPPYEIDGSIYCKLMDLTDFQCQVLYFIHTVGFISKYEIEIVVSYSITHMPFLCSIGGWLCSDQYRFLFVSLTHHKNLRSQGKNEQRNREENQQSLQKPSRTLLSNKPFSAGINLTGYHPPQAPRGFCTKRYAQPQGFCTKRYAQPQSFCTTENAWGWVNK